ncbi:hypothetical protein ACFLT1_01470 [Bacteroidota bacterium]
MKHLTSILLAAILVLSACNTADKQSNTEEGFVIKKGLNTSHWLSQTEIRGEEREAYMQAEDFIKIVDILID